MLHLGRQLAVCTDARSDACLTGEAGLRRLIMPSFAVRERLTAGWDAHPLAADLLLLAFVTAVAGALRLTLLGSIPFGLHPDEAQVGTDVHQILEHGWIGIYTQAALGQPAGHAYLSTPAIWLMGDTVFALRITIALVALAAVPLLYALVRISLGRTEAFFAAALLAISYWHLLYSRVAHWSITYGTVLLAVLLFMMLGLRQRRRAWFAAAGALLGLGMYTYNVYPIAVVAVAVFIAVLTVAHRRSLARPWWLGAQALFWVAALVTALPMIVYVADRDVYYWRHVDRYETQRITSSVEYREASFTGRAEIIGRHLKRLAAAYTYDDQPDGIDASGLRPVFDPLSLALLAAGALIAFMRRREPMIIAALCCAFVLPLPALLQTESTMRQPVAAAPFLMVIAALPLATLWRAAQSASRRAWIRTSAATLVGAAVCGIAAQTVSDYFWDWRTSGYTRFVYHAEITSAALYLHDLPDGTYVYFISERHPLDLATVRFLAPGIEGEDRSARFGNGKLGHDLDRSRAAVVVMLGRHTGLVAGLRSAYPGGRAVTVRRHGLVQFTAYELPPALPP
jgi:4-amino-4-deoxy-L-arabinose transferase-like glycosyltransferase